MNPPIPAHLLAYRAEYLATQPPHPFCVSCNKRPMLWSTTNCENCASYEELSTEIDVLGWHVDNYPVQYTVVRQK